MLIWYCYENNMSICEHLICARHSLVSIVCINLFSPHHSPLRLLMSLFCSWKFAAEKLNMLKISPLLVVELGLYPDSLVLELGNLIAILYCIICKFISYVLFIEQWLAHNKIYVSAGYFQWHLIIYSKFGPACVIIHLCVCVCIFLLIRLQTLFRTLSLYFF